MVKFFISGNIGVTGTLTQGTNDQFTSVKDDSRGGDTNGDGSITAPANGDWLGIQILPSGEAGTG